MSTLYATFPTTRAANSVVTRLIQEGVRPEDISLIGKQNPKYPSLELVRDKSGSVGDASYIVGRADDPEALTNDLPPYVEFSTVEASPIGGVDTSEIGLDVDTVDEADDSQELADQMTYPRDGVSQSQHQADDLGLAIETGFPTTIPVNDNFQDIPDNLLDGLDAIVIPGFGYVMGGGALATAALDFSSHNEAAAVESLLTHLKSEGVPRWAAERYVRDLMDGGNLVAVNVTPGELDEGAIESLFESRGGQNTTLYDAPRYGQPGYLS